MNSAWTLGIIGGTGRIACATVCELIGNRAVGEGRVRLFGRSPEKLARNLALIGRVSAGGPSRVSVEGAATLDETLRGCDYVLYNATPGLDDVGGYASFGIANGAHILHVAERVARLAPEAWLMVDTNPPDIPLAAARRKFSLRRVIGLCNASDIFQRLVSAYLGCAEKDLSLPQLGVNHEVYYLDILKNGVSVYDALRRNLPAEYDPAKLKTPYLQSFPEWPIAFRNNIALMQATGYLTTPVGGPSRFQGMPLKPQDYGALVKRPADADYDDLLKRNAGREEILKVIRRCGGGIPVYIGRVLGAMLSGVPAEESIQVLNEGILTDQPETTLLQVNCRLSRGHVEAPKALRPPDFISAVLAQRIRQADLAGRALAEQDPALLRQALLACPERVDLALVERIVSGKERVEPHMQLN